MDICQLDAGRRGHEEALNLFALQALHRLLSLGEPRSSLTGDGRGLLGCPFAAGSGGDLGDKQRLDGRGVLRDGGCGGL
jgi:hypothetical protein